MIGWLNLGSLLFGIIAWILPVINIVLLKRQHYKNWAKLSLFSLGLCATSLCFQILSTDARVNVEDWSALLDTHWLTTNISWVLLVITLVLNIFTYQLYSKITAK